MESPDPIDVAVGTRIRIRRKQLGVTQTALAEHLGVSFQQVQKYERGANRISASMLVRSAEKLDMTVAELVGEAEGAVVDAGVLGMLASSSALELLKAFTSIEEPRLRAAILELARAASAATPVLSRRLAS